MSKPDDPPAEVENAHHTYVTNRIPWYVHAIWICFWIIAIAYVIVYQLPMIPVEIQTPP